LGRIVAKYLQAFGMNIMATSQNLQQAECDPGVRAVSLETLLAESHADCLHANFISAKTKMLGTAEFSRMKAGSWFINTARGELVDDRASLSALKSGHLGGAALGVLDKEQE
jgi:phosphoglycerate dehydrogenase-like enzyme